MNNKVLKTLEFYKIINMLLDRSQSIIGKNVIKNSHISKELSEVQKLLDETDEAYRFIIKHRLPGISNIDNLGEEKIINCHNLVFFLERKQNDINRFDNQKLTIRDVKELKNLLIISKSYKKCLEEKEKLINGIYTKIKNSRTLDKKLKETLLGFIAFIEAK